MKLNLDKFLLEYYSGKRVDLLIKKLKDYKHLKKHKKEELYLADLLKQMFVKNCWLLIKSILKLICIRVKLLGGNNEINERRKE